MRHLALCLLLAACGSAGDTAPADSAALDVRPIDAGPTLASLDLVGETHAIDGVETPGTIVSVVACTDPATETECTPVGWSVIDGRLYPRAGYPAWRVWFLR